MRLCISSVLTASVLITVIILQMYPLMQSGTFIRKAGTSWIMLLLVCVLFRMFLPVEYFYTKTFRFTKILTTVRKALTFELVSAGKISICIYHIFLAVWIVGSVAGIFTKCKAYFKIRKEITIYGTGPTEEVSKTVQMLEAQYPELKEIDLVYTPFVSSPMLMGIRNQKIVLPEKDFSNLELQYILSHEIMHIRNHDTFWKLLIDILCTIYWWNPAFNLLKNEAFNIIEIKNDIRLTEKMSPSEKEEYLDCLYNVAKLSAVPSYIGTVAFANKAGRELKRRFNLIITGVSDRKLVKWSVYFAIVAITFASSCVIFEPRFLPPEDLTGVMDTNTYIIEEDGIYNVYVDGEFGFSIDSLEYLPENTIVK